jgi:uncharacterized protein
MFNKLLPKEEKYFDNFSEMISHIKEMANQTYILFSSDKPDPNFMHTLKPLEVRCDEIASKIIKRLNTTFITPFDREDVFALTKRLSNIADMLLGAAVRIDTFSITFKIKYADTLSFIIQKQINELNTAIQHLRVKSVNEMKNVKALETEADGVYHQALKYLFENEKDSIKIMKEKEILDILENVSDKCQSAANVILSIFIKNS